MAWLEARAANHGGKIDEEAMKGCVVASIWGSRIFSNV